MANTENTSPELLFRPAKKRKIFRRRDVSAQEHYSDNEGSENAQSKASEAFARASSTAFSTDGSNDNFTPQRESAVSRGHRQSHPRRGGIGFSNVGYFASTPTVERRDTVPTDDRLDVLQTTVRHFAPQTGHVADVNDKHLAAYVDSKLAKMRSGENHESNDGSADKGSSTDRKDSPQRQEATVGRLQEVDLGPDATARNVARTEAATRKLNGETVLQEEEEESSGQNKKPIAGKNGKRQKKRWRRGSDDLKRDSIVDAVLQESKLDLYEPPSFNNTPSPGASARDEQGMDDRIAEQFERDYMDALVQHRRNDPPKQQAKASKRPDDSILKGPKLGGSRSARAQMHALELEKQKMQNSKPVKR